MANDAIIVEPDEPGAKPTPEVALQMQTPTLDNDAVIVTPDTPSAPEQKQLQGGIDYSHKALDYIRAGLDQSQDDTRDAVIWSSAMANQLTDDEAAHMTERSTIQRQRDMGLHAYEMAHDLSIEHAVKELVGMVPYLGQVAKDTIPISAAGAAVGAAHGAIVGGESTVWFAPFTEGISIPAGAGAGALFEGLAGSATGARAGVALSAARLAAGAKFKQLYHDEKIPRDTALKAAIAYGAVAGGVQAFQFGRTAVVTTRALNAVKTQMQKNMFSILGNLIKETALFVTASELQESANILTDTMIGHVGLHKPPNQDEVKQRIIKTAVHASMLGGTISTLSAGLGATAGVLFKDQTKNVHDAMTRESGAPTAQEARLLETKAELKLAKAEERQAAAQQALAEAKAKGEPVKTAQLALDVANQELAIARAEAPPKLIEQKPKADTRNGSLKGRVEETHLTPLEAADAAAKTRDKAAKKLDHLEQEAIEYKEKNLGTPIPSELKNELHVARVQLQHAIAAKRYADRDVVDYKIQQIRDAAYSKFVIEHDTTDVAQFKQNQKLMYQMVSKSGLSKDQQGEFNAAIRDSTTTHALLRSIPVVKERIAKKLEANAKEDALIELDKQVKRIKPRVQNGHPYSRFSHETDIQDILTAFEHYIKKPNDIPIIRREFIDAESSGKDVSNLYMLYEVANTVGDLGNKSSNDVYRLAARIEILVDDGLKKRAADIAKNRAVIREQSKELLDAVQGNKPIELGVATTKPREDLSGAKKYANRAGTTLFSWEGKLRVATMDGSSSQTKTVLKTLDISKTVRDVSHEKLTNGHRLFGYLEEHTEKSQDEILKHIAHGSHISNVFNLTFTDMDGATKHMKITPMEGVSYLMYLDDPTLDVGSLTRNEDLPDNAPSFERVLNNALAEADPVYRKLANGYLAYYQDAYPVVSKAVKQDTGIALPKNPYYPGNVQRAGHSNAKALEQFNLHIEEIGRPANTKVSAGHPDFTKERNSKLEIKVQNAHAAASNYINTAAQYVGWVAESKRISAVLNDPKVKEAMRRKFGPELHRDIMLHFKAAVNGGVDEQQALINFMNQLMRNIPVAALGLKPLMAVKHALSIQNSLILMPTRNLINGTVDYWANKRKADAVINSSKQFQVRNEDAKGNLLGGSAITNANLKRDSAIEKLVLLPIWGGANQFAIRPSMWALYTYRLKEGDTHEQALDAAEDVIKFQTSGTIDQLSNAARSPVVKPFTIFHQLPMRLFEESWLAWGEYFHEPTKVNLERAIKLAIIAHVGNAIFPLVDALYHQLTAPNDNMKQQAWAMFWLALAHGPMPVMWGEVTDALALETSNNLLGTHFHPRELSTIQLDAINHTERLYNDILKDAANGNWSVADMVRLGLDFAMGPGIFLGVPAAPPLKILRLFTGNTDDKKMELH